jgi:hypothetical protein
VEIFIYMRNFLITKIIKSKLLQGQGAEPLVGFRGQSPLLVPRSKPWWVQQTADEYCYLNASVYKNIITLTFTSVKDIFNTIFTLTFTSVKYIFNTIFFNLLF